MSNIRLSREDFNEMSASDQVVSADEQREHYRELIRQAFEDIGQWPIEWQMLDESGNFGLKRSSSPVELVINIQPDLNGGLFAQVGYRTPHSESTDFEGLVIMTGTQEIVFDRVGPDSRFIPLSILHQWDGIRGPLTFELRDLD